MYARSLKWSFVAKIIETERQTIMKLLEGILAKMCFCVRQLKLKNNVDN